MADLGKEQEEVFEEDVWEDDYFDEGAMDELEEAELEELEELEAKQVGLASADGLCHGKRGSRERSPPGPPDARR